MKSTADLEYEKTDKELVQGILFNVLPSTIAERLKLGERILADHYNDLTIFFSDIVGVCPLLFPSHSPYVILTYLQFTPLCERLTPVQGMHPPMH